MTLSELGDFGDFLGGVAVVVTLAYLALQIRSNTAALGAQTRHSLSELALQLSIFRAAHADRFEKLKSNKEPTAGDLEFRHWAHVQMMVYGEAYFHHFQIGLMPQSHWSSFVSFMDGYIESVGFREFWEEAGSTFASDYQAWIDAKLQESRAT
jgi:hypothetical protein